MSVLATVLIAIAAAFVGFIIGILISDFDVYPSVVAPYTEPPKTPVKTCNAEPPPVPAVHNEIVLPKRISKDEYNKRVDACLKEAVTKAVTVYVPVSDKKEKRRIIKAMYDEWKDKLCYKLYRRKYDPEFPRLDITVRKTSSDKSGYRPYNLRFDASWTKKEPYDCISYLRSHK